MFVLRTGIGLFPLLFVSMALSGCVTTNTTAIAPDTFRLDTRASGWLFKGSAGPETLLRAAQIAQQNGFQYFAIMGSAGQVGERYLGSIGSADGGSLSLTSIYSPTENVSVLVKMYNSPVPGAWNVADVIAKKGQMLSAG